MTESSSPLFDLTDEGLHALLNRAIRNTLILGVVPALILAWTSSWRNGAMLVVGAAISAASLWEWKRLARLIAVKMDQQKAVEGAPARAPVSTALVVIFFLVRLVIFAAAIYGALKWFQGSPIALLCGLGFAIITLAWEAIRLLRG